MSLYTLSLLLTFGAAVAFLGWLIVRGGTLKEAPAPPEPAKVRKPRGHLRQGFCPTCGVPGVYLRDDGMVNRRYGHVCDPAAVQAHVWSVSRTIEQAEAEATVERLKAG